ncbi:unnamed protein product [Heligmosomoides polygyrus]|uniref:Uncharacterized protein n=1 Tax=Heligmosomoides polygyrus TaxID=6339 RepID=A0A183G4L3_HELPZ|nr:unnamed protein product [Heligmosomoides polygyrus]
MSVSDLNCCPPKVSAVCRHVLEHRFSAPHQQQTLIDRTATAMAQFANTGLGNVNRKQDGCSQRENFREIAQLSEEL